MPSGKSYGLIAVAVVLVIALGFYFAQPAAVTSSNSSAPSTSLTSPASSASQSQTASATAQSWSTTQLKDVLTGQTFKITELNKPVLIELMAIWCPFCTQQQAQLQAVQQKLGSKITLVSVDIDSRETPGALLKYSTDHGFKWHWTTDSGGVFASFFQYSPPDTAVIVVSPDGTYKVFAGKITGAGEFLTYLQSLGVQ